jgi:hypothetical protein
MALAGRGGLPMEVVPAETGGTLWMGRAYASHQ